MVIFPISDHQQYGRLSFYTKTIPIKRSKNYIWLIFLNTFHVAGYTGFLQLFNE
jgi:hypothetical protein